jgi:hypothetical protein
MTHKVTVTVPPLGWHDLTVLSTLPELAVDEASPAGTPRWLDGVKWVPAECGWLAASSADGACVAHVMDTSLRRTCREPVTQKPFRVDDAFRASVLIENSQDIPADMKAFWSQSLSAVFANELLSGTASGGHSLSSVAAAPGAIPFGSGAVVLTSALQVIETHLALQIGNRRGVIHLPPGLLALAVASYGLQERGGRWYTPVGNLVAVDAGYVTSVTPADGGAVAAAANEFWVYGSGPVGWARLDAPHRDAVNIGIDECTRWNEGYGIWVFDPCPVTAVLVEYAADVPVVA